MTITPQNLSIVQPGEKFGMILVGKEQSGKSLMAATAPKPVLFIDTDKKAESLAGKKDVYALTIADPTNTQLQPTGFQEVLNINSCLEAKNSLQALKSISPQCANWPDVPVQTLVYDSIATLAQMARNYILYTNQKELAYAVSIAGQTHRVPKNWTAWGAETSMVENCIMQARALPNVNVIATLHETMEEDPRSTEDAPMYTGRIEVYPVRYKVLLKYFSEIWRLVRTAAGAPIVFTAPTLEFAKAGTVIGAKVSGLSDITAIIQQSRMK